MSTRVAAEELDRAPLGPPSDREQLGTDKLSREQLLHAHRLAYTFLSDILDDGPSANNLAHARASDSLAAAIDGTAAGHHEQSLLETLQADHHHVFGYCVVPYEGVYLRASMTIGHSPELVHLYTAAGFDPGIHEPEHLATCLRALAHLSIPSVGQQTLQLQLIDRLLLWVPMWRHAVLRVQRPFATALATLITELLHLHRESLSTLPDTTPKPLAGAPTLDLDNPATGIGDIADFLLTPLATGVFLSRHDLTGLARRLQLPCGFGGRAVLLRNLLRSAARFGRLTQVLDDLTHLWTHARDQVAVNSPWHPRIRQTLMLLQRIRTAGLTEDTG